MNEIYLPILDIETVAIDLPDRVKLYRERSIEPHRGIKDPVKQNNWIADKVTELYSRDALDPYYCRIICVSYTDPKNVVQSYFGDEMEILNLIKSTARLSDGRFITFNGSTFDIPVIRTRCMFLDIPQIGLYNIKDFDLMRLLQMNSWFDRTQLKSLALYASLLDIDYDVELMNVDIANLYTNNDFKTIENHCRQDIRITQKIWHKIRNYVNIGESL